MLHTSQELSDIDSGKAPARFLLWKDRHGELFAYMHSQLLARYAAERLSVNLPPVVPLDDYRASIPEDYRPGIIIKSDGTTLTPAPRPANARLNDITVPDFRDRPGARIVSQELFRDRLLAAVVGPTSANRPATLSGLSEHIEPTDRSATSYFGALHNDGHLLIAFHDNDPQNKGVMFWEEAAIRDPVFYRWHAHIDGIFRTYQNDLDPYDFADLPSVEAKGLAILADSGQRNILITELRQRDLKFSNAQPAKIDYLSHEDFTYEILAFNDSDTDVQITVRIFMAPEDNRNDRTAWIEMDKFRHVLPSRATETIVRSSKDSSVIRHPVLTSQILEGHQPWPNERGSTPGCRCGWPYTLLLPRGNAAGIDFRFIALLSAGEDIVTSALDSTNSASYCGVQDATYPDLRPMGYPFDRPSVTSVDDWIIGPGRLSQVASSVVTIVHR